MTAEKRKAHVNTAQRRVRFIDIALVAGLLVGSAGCATGPSERGTVIAREASCLPTFPDEDGWYGGDAAFSVPLGAPSSISLGEDPTSTLTNTPAAVSLWFFGDSFVAREGESAFRHARVYPFIHNAVGRSTCGKNGQWLIDYDWKKTQPPHAFFQPDPSTSWVRRAISESGETPYYWPLSSFVLDDTLYVGLLRVQPAEASGPFNLPFLLVGADLARIKNAVDPPDQWQVEITSLSDATGAIPGSAWVVEGPFVYAFAYQNGAEGRTPQILTRLPLSALGRWPSDLSSHLETLGHSGEWESGLAPSRAKILMDDDATEMSVHFSQEEKAWLAVYSDPTPASPEGQKGVIWLRRAKRLEGPWSPPQPLAIVPERSPGNPLALDPNLFCYAGKAHPQFGGPDELVVTYVCNLYARTEKEIPGTLERLRESPGIYRPRAMRIRIPPPPGDH